MTSGRHGGKSPRAGRRGPAGDDPGGMRGLSGAMDRWLQEELQAMYRDFAAEPLPNDFVALAGRIAKAQGQVARGDGSDHPDGGQGAEPS